MSLNIGIDTQKALLNEMARRVSSDMGINIEIQVVFNNSFNAQVECVEKDHYVITFYRGCFDLDRNIQKYIKRYDHNDAKYFKRIYDLLFAYSEDYNPYSKENYRETLNSLFSGLIILHVFFHEIGHIEAGHVSKDSSLFVEFNGNDHGGFERQEHEMLADWLSTTRIIENLYLSLKDSADPMDAEEQEKLIQKVIITYWIAFAIEYQMLERKPFEKAKDTSLLTHPHPALRMYYNVEALREAVSNILIKYFKADEESSEKVSDSITENAYLFVLSFLGITNTPIANEIESEEIVKYYMKLRSVSSALEKKKDGCLHFQELSKEYINSYEKYKDLYNSYN